MAAPAQEEISRNIRLETARVKAGLPSPPLMTPLPPNPTASDWKRVNDALANWIRQPRQTGTLDPATGRPYRVSRTQYQEPPAPPGPGRYMPEPPKGAPPSDRQYTRPAPWHQVVSAPLAMGQQMGRETSALATSAIPTGMPVLGKHVSTKAEAERLRRQGMGVWEASLQAYQDKPMPWGVKGGMEAILDPWNVVGIGGLGGARMLGRLGAGALGKAAPRIASRFPPTPSR